ncbi:hypothetical protein [Leucobacter chromiiresistens]|uniref:Uncharacterized protein n=1 Tax=Leucobacter chromiiresistens TaxID=1079994 RepID=A0A147EET5_9MICO|nr:hypothetical protein [Leucobacter chromiiresistens]KTR82943.1 hypothetical protein NS354_10775 [Leucobacter chromiiresistens]
MIDWAAFLIVFGSALVSALFVVSLYSLGLRFLATPAPPARLADGSVAPNGPSRDDEDDDVDAIGRPRWATVLANICFGLSVLVVLVGIFLIVPALHFW